MKNTVAQAERWTEFLAKRAEIYNGQRLVAHFKVGRITRLCDCGCNTYDLEVPANADVEPLAPPSDRGGPLMDMSFYTANPKGTVSFVVFGDKRGNLAGIEVDYCANSFPVPNEMQLIEPPFHAYGKLKT